MGHASSETTKFPSRSTEESDDWARLLEQSGSASSIQQQTWLHRPTASDDIETLPPHSPLNSTRPATEDETPTRPVTPIRIAIKDLYWESAIDEDLLTSKPPFAPSIAHARLCLILEESDKTVFAGKPKCAVCSTDFTPANVHQRVEHFNTCWKKLRKAATENAGMTEHPDPSRLVLQQSNPQCLESAPTTRTNNFCTLCSLPLGKLSSTDAFEHRILCQRALATQPTVCPRCDASFTTNEVDWNELHIAEHIHNCSTHPGDEGFQSTQEVWTERRFTRKDSANCALCSQSLEPLDDVMAFHHRRSCLERKRPVYCPVCFDPLPIITVGGKWKPEDILWHIHQCQRGKKLSVIDKDDFDILEARCFARIQSVWRMFSRNVGSVIGPRKGWTFREHQHSYRSKMEAGRDNTAGLYSTPSSKLRNVATHAEDGGIRIVQSVKSRRAVWSSIERFRRSAHSVYKMLEHRRMISCTKSEYQTDEVVYDWDKNRTITTIDGQDHAMLCGDLVAKSTGGSSVSLKVWSTFMKPSTPEEEDDRGRPRIRTRKSGRASRVSSRERRRHLAVDKATKAGIRVPPGFELRSLGLH
ncbi:hypothetical protein BU25DRAFT_422091 [Macroventuria anomochaeta]|uniref:Uncharacterized protein n=1 Tax=Macroventuria anomochaeta TaxID=301207 RepID=A0ACB6RZT7_9PLEO|nr:uncharacterized protein BU25DRAFT_422091 [Macroventuria anomochaeta]KAF2627227.1 hypothetical protein BU25DRAFT_422091 [Macroventuria anomochaeta]